MKITLPWPPSVNTYWRSYPLKTKSGGVRVIRHLSTAGTKFREAACGRMLGLRSEWDTSDARLAVTITLHPPTRRSFDVDNFVKGPLDAMAYAGVYRDDSQIDRLEIIRGEKRPGGEAVVEIRELPERIIATSAGGPSLPGVQS